jgi:hypothetical protein
MVKCPEATGSNNPVAQALCKYVQLSRKSTAYAPTRRSELLKCRQECILYKFTYNRKADALNQVKSPPSFAAAFFIQRVHDVWQKCRSVSHRMILATSLVPTKPGCPGYLVIKKSGITTWDTTVRNKSTVCVTIQEYNLKINLSHRAAAFFMLSRMPGSPGSDWIHANSFPGSFNICGGLFHLLGVEVGVGVEC